MTNKLTYFTARTSMFGIGFFLIFQNSGKDAWIPVILGSMLGIIILYLYRCIHQYLVGEKIENSFKNNFMGLIYKLFFIIFYLYLMIIILMLLQIFVNSFYLTNTPKLLISTIFIFLAVYLSYKGKFVLENLSNILCIFSLVIILFFAFSLIKYSNLTNVLPIYTESNFTIIKCSIIYALISAVPQIININYQYNFKRIIKDYLLASTTILFIVFFTIIALGEPLIKMYSFPEYTVLRQIKILNFIENIENISAFIWYFDMFIMLSTLCINLKNTLPKRYNLIYYFLCIIIVLVISGIYIANDYKLLLNIVYTYPYVLLFSLIIFITLLFYLKRKKYSKN